MKISPEEFVKIWQTSNYKAEVCNRTGMRDGAVNSRAALYRHMGVPLKKFQQASRKKLDVEALKQLAESLEKKQP